MTNSIPNIRYEGSQVNENAKQGVNDDRISSGQMINISELQYQPLFVFFGDKTRKWDFCGKKRKKFVKMEQNIQ